MFYLFLFGVAILFFWSLLAYGLSFYTCLPFVFRDLFSKIKRSFKRFRDHSIQSDPFDLYGVYIYCGRVGSGKTISMLRRASELKRKFPMLKIYANFNTSIADGFIHSWEDIVNIENIDENGVNQGVLFLFDEIHLTFDCQGWQHAPDNLLEYISLQRHLHKCIFGSSQVWTRVNKIIKEQTDFVIECDSLFSGRLIRNVCFTNENYQINGTKKDSGSLKRPREYKECFVATDNLRSLYDTDEIIGCLSISEQSDSEKLQKVIKDALRCGSA